MGVFSKQFLSASPNGLPIKITGTATGTANTIHASASSAKDVMWLHAVNTTGGNVDLTIEFGGVVSPDHHIKMRIEAQSGPILVVPGIPLTGSVTVKAFASVANAVNIVGYVDRISETVGGGVAYTAPYDTKAVRFSGAIGERLDIGSASELQFERDEAFSIAVWFRLRYGELSEAFGYLASNTDGFRGWGLYLDHDSPTYQIRFDVTDYGGTPITVAYTLTNIYELFNDRVWHQLVGTYAGDNTNGKLYLDGILIKAATGTLSATILANNLRIGNHGTNNLQWQGLIGPVGIWNKELSADEVSVLFNGRNTLNLLTSPAPSNLAGYWRMGEGDSGTTIADWSGNGNDATMNNLTVADDVEPMHLHTPSYSYTPLSSGLKCVEFAGGDDELSNTGDRPFTQHPHFDHPFTISFWARATTGGSWMVVFGNDHTSWLHGVAVMDSGASQITVYLGYSGSAMIYSYYDTEGAQRDGNWHHYVVRYATGRTYSDSHVWVDGVRRRVTGGGVGLGANQLYNANNVFIGDGFVGKIAEVAYWNHYLSDFDIMRLYNKGIPTDILTDFPEGLIHYWRMGDGPEDAYPTIKDVVGGFDLTMTNMDSGDIVTDHPANPT